MITTFGETQSNIILDYNSYNSFDGRYNNSTLYQAGVIITPLNLTGKGYIDNIHVKDLVTMNYFELWVDDVLLMRSGCGGTIASSFILTPEYLNVVNDTTLKIVANTYYCTYAGNYITPYDISDHRHLKYKVIDSTDYGVCTIEKPIVFNKNFKIKVYYNNTANSTCKIGWHGGIK